MVFTRPDLSSCFSPDRVSHLCKGAIYAGKCVVCRNLYRRKTKAWSHTRICQYREEIWGKVAANSMASHLSGEYSRNSVIATLLRLWLQQYRG